MSRLLMVAVALLGIRVLFQFVDVFRHTPLNWISLAVCTAEFAFCVGLFYVIYLRARLASLLAQAASAKPEGPAPR